MKSKQGDSLSPVTPDTSAARFGDTKSINIQSQTDEMMRVTINSVMPDIHYNSVIYGEDVGTSRPGCLP